MKTSYQTVSILVSALFAAVLILVLLTNSTRGQVAADSGLSTWTTIRTPLTTALVQASIEGQEIGDDDPDMDVRLKVGYPYQFKPYGVAAGARLTFDFVWQPQSAIATSKFKLYDVQSLDLKDWRILREFYGEKPARTAFVVSYDGGYVGMPVKWNRQLASTMEAGFKSAAAAGDESNSVITAMMAEVVDYGAFKNSMAPLVGGDYPVNSTAFDASFAVATDRLDEYSIGDVSVFKAFSAGEPIYIALSDIPPEFEAELVDSVITQGGASGQPLGSVMPSWPFIDD